MPRILCALMGVVGKSEIRNLQLFMLPWRVLHVIPTEGGKRASGGIHSTRVARSGQACGVLGQKRAVSSLHRSLHSGPLGPRSR